MAHSKELSKRNAAWIGFFYSTFVNTVITVVSGSYGLSAAQDEFGYIEKAYALAGVPIGDQTKYSFGLSILLLPLSVIHSALSSIELWTFWVILVNSAAYGIFIAYVVKWRSFFWDDLVGKGVTESSYEKIPARTLIVLLIAMPTLVLAGSVAMATSVLVALFTSMMFHTARCFFRESGFDLIVSVILLLAAVLVHPTAVLLLGISSFYFFASLIRDQIHRARKVFSFGLLVLTALAGWKLQAVVSEELNQSVTFSSASESYSNMSISRFIPALISWRFYLIIGSLGCVLFLISGGSITLLFKSVAMGVNLPRSASTAEAAKCRRSIGLLEFFCQPAVVVLLGSVVAGPIFTASIFYTSQRSRADDWMYLRYALPASALLVALAITDSQSRKRRRIPLAFPLFGLMIATGIDLAVAGPQTDLFVGNFSGFALFHLLEWRVGIGFGVIIIVSSFLLIFRSGKILVISFLFLLSFVGVLEHKRISALGHNASSPLTDLIDNATQEGDCVVFDGEVPEDAIDSGPAKHTLDMFRLERHRFLYFDLKNLARVVGPTYKGCSDFRLSYDMSSEGTLVAREAFGGLGLFVRDDRTTLSLVGEAVVDESMTGVQYLRRGETDACLRAGCYELAAESRWLQRVNGDTISHGPYSTLDSGTWRVKLRFAAIPKDRDAFSLSLDWLRNGEPVKMPISPDETSWVDPHTVEFTFEISSRVQMFEVITVDMDSQNLLVLDTLSVLMENRHAN